MGFILNDSFVQNLPINWHVLQLFCTMPLQVTFGYPYQVPPTIFFVIWWWLHHVICKSHPLLALTFLWSCQTENKIPYQKFFQNLSFLNFFYQIKQKKYIPPNSNSIFFKKSERRRLWTSRAMRTTLPETAKAAMKPSLMESAILSLSLLG